MGSAEAQHGNKAGFYGHINVFGVVALLYCTYNQMLCKVKRFFKNFTVLWEKGRN